MKYSELKAIFVASEVTVSASKTLISFSNSTKKVQLSWSDDKDKDGLKGKPTHGWVANFSEFPSAGEHDGEIVEILPVKKDGLIKIKLSSNVEVFLYCQFVDGGIGSEDLLWATYPLTDGDAAWFRTHHGATKMHLEVHGESVLALATYKDSGLQALRLLQAKSSTKTSTTIKGERIVFSPETIPLKGMKGELKLYRFSNGIQFAYRKGDEVVSYRTPILETIPGKTLDHFKILATGDLVECPKDFGKKLTALVKDMITGNKANFSMKMENGVLIVGKDGICLPSPEKEATASVLFAFKKIKKMMELVPSFPKRIGVSFPDRLVGVNADGLKIPEYLVITLINDEIVDKFDDNLIYCDRFLFNCVVKDPYKLYGVEAVTERNKERIVESTKKKVEETAQKSKEILDAIASKVASEKPPFDTDKQLTPEFLQEKMEELEKYKRNAIAPLERAMNLRAFKAQTVIVQVVGLEGDMFRLVYEVDSQAVSLGYYDNTTVVD